ncbi:hypothetical protein [Prevotella falsenii]|uniref:hypothetical protein n=1 Tax=Prevotella falsenii TaxID=515414 RepID=UPI00046A91D9|nr:hypothetical protein [Prevotella falsenii]
MDDLIKERSIKSCIALGYKDWQQHLGETFSRTRWRILLSAVMFTAFLISALMGTPKWLCILLLAFSLNSVAVKVRSLMGEMETALKGKKLIKKNIGYYVYFFCLSSIVELCTMLVVGAPLLLLLYMYWLDCKTVKMGDFSTLSTTFWVLTGLTAFATTIAVRFINTWEDYAELYIFGTIIARNRAKRQGRTKRI